MSSGIKIVIVDDHPVVREGLASILSLQKDLDVVGAFASGREAVDALGELEADVVLLDLEMPEMDGVETLELLRARDAEVKVIVFTVFDTDDHILSAVQAGARGYLLKNAPRKEIFQAIRTVCKGGSMLQPLVASKLLRRVSGQAAAIAELTGRERQVLDVLAQGLQNKEIADALNISERTVKFHVSAILRKLGAGNRTEAVSIASRQGLTKM